MGAYPTNLDAPPPQPPGLTAQTGAGGPKPTPPPAGSVLGGGGDDSVNGAMAMNPQGALLAQKSAVEKVLNQMASMNQAFAPFAKRALDTIEAGLQAVQQASSQGAPGGPTSSNGTSMQPPMDGGKGIFPV